MYRLVLGQCLALKVVRSLFSCLVLGHGIYTVEMNCINKLQGITWHIEGPEVAFGLPTLPSRVYIPDFGRIGLLNGIGD